jgi:hypothetical protein
VLTYLFVRPRFLVVRETVIFVVKTGDVVGKEEPLILLNVNVLCSAFPNPDTSLNIGHASASQNSR